VAAIHVAAAAIARWAGGSKTGGIAVASGEGTLNSVEPRENRRGPGSGGASQWADFDPVVLSIEAKLRRTGGGSAFSLKMASKEKPIGKMIAQMRTYFTRRKPSSFRLRRRRWIKASPVFYIA
jgi:hypothetical protein